jgi:hypothetical protein
LPLVQGRSSMSDDLTAGRSTEVDWINGEVVRLAERLGRSAPIKYAVVPASARGRTNARESGMDWQSVTGGIESSCTHYCWFETACDLRIAINVFSRRPFPARPAQKLALGQAERVLSMSPSHPSKGDPNTHVEQERTGGLLPVGKAIQLLNPFSNSVAGISTTILA